MLMNAMDCPTHPALTSYPLTTLLKNTQLFPMLVPAYLAWQRSGYKLNWNYDTTLSMPLFNNIYMLDSEGEPVKYQAGDELVIAQLPITQQAIKINMLVTELSPPTGAFNYDCSSTHRARLRTAAELDQLCRSACTTPHSNQGTSVLPSHCSSH